MAEPDAFLAPLRVELRDNRGFRNRLAILTYRLAYYADTRPRRPFVTRGVVLLYQILRLACAVLDCGEPPMRGAKIGWGLRLPHAFHGISINGHCVIGSHLTLSHHTTLGRLQGRTCAIRIGDHVSIGAHCLILGTVTIGDHCHIGPGSTLLNADIPAHSTVVAKPTTVTDAGAAT